MTDLVTRLRAEIDGDVNERGRDRIVEQFGGDCYTWLRFLENIGPKGGDDAHAGSLCIGLDRC